MTYNYSEETNFLFGSEITLLKRNFLMFGEKVVPAEDTKRGYLCMTAFRQLSSELKDYEMFTYKSLVQEQDRRAHV